jgi:hypothetical protein
MKLEANFLFCISLLCDIYLSHVPSHLPSGCFHLEERNCDVKTVERRIQMRASSINPSEFPIKGGGFDYLLNLDYAIREEEDFGEKEFSEDDLLLTT